MEIKKDKKLIVFKNKKELLDFLEISTDFSDNKIFFEIPFLVPETNIKIPYIKKDLRSPKK